MRFPPGLFCFRWLPWRLIPFGLLPAVAVALDAGAAGPDWEAPPERQRQGQFWRYHWYERGLTNGNPAYERRFRVNSAEAVLHPEFGRRVEARENGLMLIRTEEDLFHLVWNTAMLPAQREVAVRAAVRFKDSPNLVFLTAATGGLEIPDRPGVQVVLFAPHDQPVPFWSRAGQRKTCHLDLDVAPERIERAELHVVTWTGGAGTIKDYFKLNGVHYPVAEGDRHELVYSRVPVAAEHLRRGLNRIERLSDTDHHGIEIIHPGPALMVRCGGGEPCGTATP